MMQRRQPTKEDIIAALQRIAADSSDGRVSHSRFKDDTGWDRYWFDRHWPAGGYQAACEEAGVRRGAIIGVETNTRVTDEEMALRFAEAVQSIGKIPTLKRLAALTRMNNKTITREDTYDDAKWRIIRTYFELPAERRKGEGVEQMLRAELARLNDVSGTGSRAPAEQPAPSSRHSVQVPPEYVSLVREFRDRGEEEKRQLVAQFFHEILGYKRARIRSEHKHNDVRVHDRRDKPWLVVEVKPRLETERDRRAARRQGFDYAHRLGMRFVVISDGDYYEVFDRCCGERLRYDEMRQGGFYLTALRSRDADLLGLLSSER